VVVDRRLSVDPSDLNASVGVVWTRFPGSGAKQCCHCELGGQLKRKKLESLATILPVDGLVPANTRGHDGGNVRFCAERGLLGTGPFGDWAFWGLGLLGTGPAAEIGHAAGVWLARRCGQGTALGARFPARRVAATSSRD
jgi:hypothetical protein